jgi:hypothetical protein
VQYLAAFRGLVEDAVGGALLSGLLHQYVALDVGALRRGLVLAMFVM